VGSHRDLVKRAAVRLCTNLYSSLGSPLNTSERCNLQPSTCRKVAIRLPEQAMVARLKLCASGAAVVRIPDRTKPTRLGTGAIWVRRGSWLHRQNPQYSGRFT